MSTHIQYDVVSCSLTQTRIEATIVGNMADHGGKRRYVSIFSFRFSYVLTSWDLDTNIRHDKGGNEEEKHKNAT